MSLLIAIFSGKYVCSIAVLCKIFLVKIVHSLKITIMCILIKYCKKNLNLHNNIFEFIIHWNI